MEFVEIPEGGIYRAGRWEDVERFPEPAQRISLATQLRDGYRWEDPLGNFSTAKFSASAEAAIGRSIARYRQRQIVPGKGIISAILEFLESEPDPGDPDLVEGRVPEDVIDDLYLLHVPASDDVLFVDLEAEATRSELQRELGPALSALGLGPLPANFAREADRRLTRLVLFFLHSRLSGGAEGRVAGIRLPGQPHPSWESFVLWRPPQLVDLTADDVGFRWVARWDEHLLAAARRLEVEIPPPSPPSS